MTWLPLLLADSSACLRWLVLRDLFNLTAGQPEVQELDALRSTDPLVTGLLTIQGPDGTWRRGTLGPGRKGSHIHTTALGLMRLGYLGFDAAFPPVQRAADYLFGQQRADGSWPLTTAVDGALQQEDGEESIPQGYDMIPLQTVFPLRALAACGYATDARAERAYEWLLAQRLEDGAWPTGKAQGVNGRVAGYRRLPHSLWGCRSNTTGALICLALHPERRNSLPARRALDLLLGRETRERFALGFEVARVLGAEPARGFMTFFARFDLGLLLWLGSRIGASRDDQRVAELVSFIRSQQGEAGLWEYAPKPQVTRWVSFDLLRSLAQFDEASEWLTVEPPSPFAPYPKREKRF